MTQLYYVHWVDISAQQRFSGRNEFTEFSTVKMVVDVKAAEVKKQAAEDDEVWFVEVGVIEFNTIIGLVNELNKLNLIGRLPETPVQNSDL